MGYTPLGFTSFAQAFPFPLLVLFTWVYNNTKGSLFLMILFHAVSDIAPFTILATSDPSIAPVLYISLNRGVVTLVVVRPGAARLSRSVALACRTVRDASRTDDGASHVSSRGRISLAVGITQSPLPLLAEVPSMEEGRQDEQRNVDRREIVGEPIREEDVGDRAASSSEGVGKLGERTAEPVRREDQALAADHRRRHSYTPIRAPREPRVEQIDHARLDREPGQGVDGLDGHEYCLWMSWMLPAPGSTGLWPWPPQTPRGHPPGRLLRVRHESPHRGDERPQWYSFVFREWLQATGLRGGHRGDL